MILIIDRNEKVKKKMKKKMRFSQIKLTHQVTFIIMSWSFWDFALNINLCLNFASIHTYIYRH